MEEKMEFRVWAPNEQVTAWMQGRIHHLPEMWAQNLRYEHREARWRNFFNLCREAHPEVVVWPEFTAELKKLELDYSYEKGTISTDVAALLVAEQNRSVGPWQKRGPWLARRGKDPLKRRRYRAATKRIVDLSRVAVILAKRRHFEQVARRMFEVAEG